MTLLYVVGVSTHWSHNELRYSLRSVAQYLPHAHVAIVGYAPEWVTNVTYIHARDRYGKPWTNQWDKLLTACADPRLPEEWVLMNDDFLFLAPPREPIRVTVARTLRQTYREGVRHSSEHYICMRDTMHLLERHNYPNALDYDTHTPMPMRTDEVLETAARFGGSGAAMAWRSVYGNHHEVPCVLGADPKVYRWPGQPINLPFMSSGHELELSPQYRAWLELARFPEPCKFEAL